MRDSGFGIWEGRLQGYLACKNPPPPGPLYDPRHVPTVGSCGVVVSYKRSTPVQVEIKLQELGVPKMNISYFSIMSLKTYTSAAYTYMAVLVCGWGSQPVLVCGWGSQPSRSRRWPPTPLSLLPCPGGDQAAGAGRAQDEHLLQAPEDLPQVRGLRAPGSNPKP